MSFNRRRNMVVGSDYNAPRSPVQLVRTQQLRRRNIDPFERDPFKIQSYNFHYAERPSHTLQNLVNRVNVPRTAQPKNFETFYYNHEFSLPRIEKENRDSSRFQEHRRRKFLYDHQNSPIISLTQHSNSPYSIASYKPYSTIGQQDKQQEQQQQQGQGQVQQQAQQQGQQQQRNSSDVLCNSSTSIVLNHARNSGTTPMPTSSLRTGCNREFSQCSRLSSTSFQERSANRLPERSRDHSVELSNNLNTPASDYFPYKSTSRASLVEFVYRGKKPSHSNLYNTIRNSSSTTALFWKNQNDGNNMKLSSFTSNANSGNLRKPPQPNGTSSNENNIRKCQLSKCKSAMDATLGCNININIKTPDNNEENVTINIDTGENTNNTNNLKGISTNALNVIRPKSTVNINGTPLNDVGAKSTKIVIPTVMSELQATQKMSSYNILPNITTSPYSMDKKKSSANIRSAALSNLVGRNLPKERLPGMVPWRLDHKPLSPYVTPKDNGNRCNRDRVKSSTYLTAENRRLNFGTSIMNDCHAAWKPNGPTCVTPKPIATLRRTGTTKPVFSNTRPNCKTEHDNASNLRTGGETKTKSTIHRQASFVHLKSPFEVRPHSNFVRSATFHALNPPQGQPLSISQRLTVKEYGRTGNTDGMCETNC